MSFLARLWQSIGRGKRRDGVGSRRALSRRPAVNWKELGAGLGRRVVQLAPYGALLVLAGAVPIVGYNVYLGLMASPHLAIKAISVAGLERLTEQEVLRAAGLEEGGHLLRLDRAEMAARLTSHPWIAQARVELEFPDRLLISVRERHAAAVVVEERSWLAEADGSIFKELAAGEFDGELPVIAGLRVSAMTEQGREAEVRSAIAEALGVLAAYRRRGLDRLYEVAEVQLDELDGLTLVAAGNRRFVLGLKDYERRLDRLERVLSHLARNGSDVTVIRADNDREPGRVSASGTGIRFSQRQASAVLPEENRQMLP